MKTSNLFNIKPQNIQTPVVTMGVFDGIHIGHQQLLQKVVGHAKKFNCDPAVITFSKHPNEIIKDSSFCSIISLENRIKLFEYFQISHSLLLHFDEKVAKISHQEFVEKYLVENLQIKGIVIGENFRFGHKGIGTPKFLQDMGKKHNFFVDIQSHQEIGNKIVSSSKIRNAVKMGQCEEARNMLGRPFSLSGEVISGQKRGRELGFPTANLRLNHSLTPCDGVYIGASMYAKTLYPVLVSIGTNPTFNDQSKSVEAYFEGFDKQIYGEEIEVYLLIKIREQIKFNVIEDLIKQMNKDKKTLLELFDDKIKFTSLWEKEIFTENKQTAKK